jgi:hypothetical protein
MSCHRTTRDLQLFRYRGLRLKVECTYRANRASRLEDRCSRPHGSGRENKETAEWPLQIQTHW